MLVLDPKARPTLHEVLQSNLSMQVCLHIASVPEVKLIRAEYHISPVHELHVPVQNSCSSHAVFQLCILQVTTLLRRMLWNLPNTHEGIVQVPALVQTRNADIRPYGCPKTTHAIARVAVSIRKVLRAGRTLRARWSPAEHVRLARDHTGARLCIGWENGSHRCRACMYG